MTVSSTLATPLRTPPPAWAKDLVIYEVNPRGFTSPQGSGDGSGSGTFRSMRERLPYLERLGVTGIWMAGHHRATGHFYGIWSVYAAYRPDQIDPLLGSPEDLRALVEDAHRRGIRIFLDVISHGVVESSPLIQEHPSWFAGGTWRMADYDYNHPEFREWWVQLWTGYVIDYGIDGFRIDVDIQDYSLWDRITQMAAVRGQPIVVFPERRQQPYHFTQQDTDGLDADLGQRWELEQRLGEHHLATRQLSCHDNGWEALAGNHYFVRGSRSRIGYGASLTHHIPLFFAGEEFDADQQGLPNLTRDLYGTGGPGGWLYGSQLRWEQLEDPGRAAMLEDVKTLLRVRSEHAHLLNADPRCGAVTRVPANGASRLVPYARYLQGEEAIVVVGNDNDEDVEYVLRLPVEKMGLAGWTAYRVTDLATGETVGANPDELDRYPVGVRGDHTPGGGVRVLRVKPA